jgi:hypothetical protein
MLGSAINKKKRVYVIRPMKYGDTNSDSLKICTKPTDELLHWGLFVKPFSLTGLC